MPEQSPPSPTTRVAVLGMHSTGKSSYVGALFLAIEDPEIETVLELADYSGNRKHVNKLAKALRSGEKLPRTETADEGSFDARLSDANGNEFEFHVPDWSGEAIDRALDKRRLRADLAEAYGECDGLLLFVHPDTVGELPEISEVEGMFDGLDAEPGAEDAVAGSVGEEADQSGRSAEEPRWDNTMASTDLKLVDALQEVVSIAPAGLRVAVVVSAWDVARQIADDPQKWLAKMLPLLDQFLEANQGLLVTSTVFGISARGRPDGERDAEFLKVKATKRTIVVGNDAAAHDLTVPIAWLRG